MPDCTCDHSEFRACLIHDPDTANDNARETRLADAAERWEKREGYLTRLVVGWSAGVTTSIHLRHPELQAIVNAAATQYGIHPVCDCYPGGFTPDAFEGPDEDCPVHGRDAGSDAPATQVIGCHCPTCPIHGRSHS